ncbi:MAG TPA: error-prone DNA polymerase [Polyangiaceae bacterium]|jgi:error-prone DNA polymerase|nr:error-prone DNA polymerase [Polyangiaceae bacterium]HNZ22138.1 error-prone DNA polymerase [Polyangiaceae bacterium]HOD21366.1 error-prone DNA polymerase [Polyangiaceae bacterium]HOE46962.1 error-prone DNA polymerase [Polyangiaceae bacterium]HOG99807.1 error-prone DNA polymerase [Polyangiaceae bacterium]
MPPFAELCARSCFSFLRGASHPEEMVEQAYKLGLHAIGLCDTDGLYGLVRAHQATQKHPIKLIVGASLHLEDHPGQLCLLARTRKGYQNLCRLLTIAHANKPKGGARLDPTTLPAHAEGLFAILVPPQQAALCQNVRQAFAPEHVRLAVERQMTPDQSAQESLAVSLAEQFRLRIVATGQPLFHCASRKPVADVLCCIREKTTLDEAGTRLLPNTEARLSSPERMTRLFADHPEWVEESVHVADGCTFSLSELQYRFPFDHVVRPGESPDEALRRLVRERLGWRYPQGAAASVLTQIEKELSLIQQLEAAPYFLSVYEIVEIARQKQILCQGRGSAANSAVCFVLGITAVDPARSNLLFERFMSLERKDPPDIDVDFEHERREEVIQEIYRRYGRERAAMVAEVISYRAKSALRDVGKAFGLSLEQVDRLSGIVAHGWESIEQGEQRLHESGFDPRDPRIASVIKISQQIQGFPRHLSIHVGGFILSSCSLHEVAPIEPARMPGRTVIPWDKDDLEALGFFKVDILALGMLTCIRKALAVVMPDRDPFTALASIPAEDPAVYEMFGRADTVGVFQIESRAQMAMLPRLRPQRFYDLVIEVAIVRPGPIQGGMVHPYLARRSGKVRVDCPHPCLGPILDRTLGVPLFQEQVMQIAIVGAGYSGGEADQLRRDMAAWRKHGRLLEHRERLLRGFEKTGISKRFGERLFKQIQGFGEYGFPESHAASFALLVYASGWLKAHHPAAFCAALINSQPMGFYSPATIVRDARGHGVQVLPIRVNASDWDCKLEHGHPANVRLGFRLLRGLGKAAGSSIENARIKGPFLDFNDFLLRTALRKDAVEILAEAGAFEDLVPERRQALWKARAPRSGSLFAHEPIREPDVALPALRPVEQLVLDYGRVGFSLQDHPMRHLRSKLEQTLFAEQLQHMRHGSKVAVAGVVINRQRPSTASGVVFMTLEDETAMISLVLWPSVFEAYRHILTHSKILWVQGTLDRREGVTHILVRAARRLDSPVGRIQSRDFR